VHAEPTFADEARGVWSRRGAVLFDVTIVVALLLVVAIGFVTDSQPRDAALVSAAVATLQVLTLIFRRVRPALCITLLGLFSLLQLPLTDIPTFGQAAVPVAIFSAAAWGSRQVGLIALTLGLVGAIIGPLDWTVGGSLGFQQAVAGVVMSGLVVVTSWAFGTLARTRQAYVGELIERGIRLERESAQKAELAATEERTRIAREMHDVVAHGLSVMIVQADGARYQLERDPALTGRALEAISATGRESLREMRRMLGLLRADEDLNGTRPQPGLADLELLLAQDLGPDITLESQVSGDLDRLPPGLGLATYRIVQEALTNVRKHAGPGSHVTVRLSVDQGHIDVLVRDDGRGASAPTDEQGHGIVGMRERVALYGGTLEAGPRHGGGFEVHASIPADVVPRGQLRKLHR
jgi:signal transduction histidine kinase